MKIPVPIAAGFGAFAIRVLGCSWRLRRIDETCIEEARRRSPRVIFAFWHGRMLALSYGYRNRSVHVLASEHRDGEIMGRTLRLLGFGHVRGSSSRGGARAIRELVSKLEEGFDLAITVDGPKGPRYVVKSGPLEVAKLSGAPIVPATASSKSHWVFSSWDAFELPKPFTKVAVRFGAAVVVPREAGPDDLEAKRIELEKALRDLTDANDRGVADE